MNRFAQRESMRCRLVPVSRKLKVNWATDRVRIIGVGRSREKT